MVSGPTQLIILLVIILILFGGKKLPELARSLGKSLGEFKKGKEEGDKPEVAAPAQPQQIPAAPAQPAPAAAQQQAQAGADQVITPEVVR